MSGLTDRVLSARHCQPLPASVVSVWGLAVSRCEMSVSLQPLLLSVAVSLFAPFSRRQPLRCQVSRFATSKFSVRGRCKQQ